MKFFSAGIGAIIADVIQALYGVLYPSNSDAAAPIEIPK